LLLGKLSTCLLEVILGGDNVMIDSKVWNKVVLIMLIHIGLKLLWSCCFGLEAFWEVSTITSRD
jgi:energy-converting hydrogenase Eha subunit C